MTNTFKRTKCDICGKIIEYKDISDPPFSKKWLIPETDKTINPWPTETLTVKFLTEQNEGTVCKPYFDTVTIEMCPECYEKLLSTWPISAYGAQGYNNYEI